MERIVKEINLEDFNQQVSPQKYKAFFTLNEINRFGRKKNKGSLAARYLIKHILIERLDAALVPVDMEILNNESGRPQLRSEKLTEEIQRKIHFSISHTKHRAMVLVIIDA